MRVLSLVSLLALSLVACTVNYHPAPSHPESEPSASKSAPAEKPQPRQPEARAEKPTKTAGSKKTTKRSPKRRVGVVARRPPSPTPGEGTIAPPPTLTFSDADLGTPFTADFRAIRGGAGKNLFPQGKITREERTRYEGNVIVINDIQAFRAHVGAWGVEGSVATARNRRYAAHRALEITRCSWIDDRTAARRAPKTAVYYPAAICYGYRYEALLEGDAKEFHAGVKARLLSYSGGLRAFARSHKLKFSIKAEGLHRKPGCSVLTFSDPQTFEGCYTPRAGEKGDTPVWVEWRVIPGRKAAKEKIKWEEANFAKCGGIREDCHPCKRWQFTSAEFSGTGGDFASEADVRVVIYEPNGRERTLRGRRPSFPRKPIIAEPGDTIDYYAYDEDVFFDDPLGSGIVHVHEYHPGGEAVGGRLTLIGTCEKY
jgi:hypothetical protein